MRLHWIGTILGRAPPPDALPCTAPASKSGQGRWVVREEERGEAICCGQGREQKGREREANNQQCIMKMHKKQPPANAHASAMHPTNQPWWRGKACSKRAQRGGKVTRVARLHGKRRGRGGTQRMRVAAEVNMWEMLVSADSPTLHRPQGTHTQSKQARGVGM